MHKVFFIMFLISKINRFDDKLGFIQIPWAFFFAIAYTPFNISWWDTLARFGFCFGTKRIRELFSYRRQTGHNNFTLEKKNYIDSCIILPKIINLYRRDINIIFRSNMSGHTHTHTKGNFTCIYCDRCTFQRVKNISVYIKILHANDYTNEVT